MNKNLISTHVFLYYQETGVYLLDRLSKIYSGNIYISLVRNNPSNKVLLEYAKKYFNIEAIFIDDYGTDQYGFYQSFKLDKLDTPWIFYCHDKSPSKMDWLSTMMDTFNNVDDLILDDRVGLIASQKYKLQAPSFEDLLLKHSNMPYENRKELVQSMHTIMWLHELQKILLSKYELGEKNFKYPIFSAGNIFLIRRSVLDKAHGCLHDNYFNLGYRTDGEVEHGMERFYYYVSNCMKYNNIFI